MTGKLRGQKRIGQLRIKGAVVLEAEVVGGIDKVIAEIGGEDQPAQIFPTACGIIPSGMVRDRPPDMCVLLPQIKSESERSDNPIVPFLHPCENRVDGFSPGGYIVAFVQHIRDLGVPLIPLSRCGRNHITACGIRVHDRVHLLKMFRIRQGTAAKFDDLTCFLLIVHFFDSTFFFLRSTGI